MFPFTYVYVSFLPNFFALLIVSKCLFLGIYVRLISLFHDIYTFFDKKFGYEEMIIYICKSI